MLTYLPPSLCCLLLILSGYHSQHLGSASLLLLLVSLAAYCFLVFATISTKYGIGEKRIQKTFAAFKRAVIPSKISNANIPHRKGGAKQIPIFWIILCCFCMVSVPVTIALAKYYSRHALYTIGCVDHLNDGQCNNENGMIEITNVIPEVNKFSMLYASQTMGKLEVWPQVCYPEKIPFRKGDKVYYMRYSFHDDRMCMSFSDYDTSYKIALDEYGRKFSERR